MTANYEKEVSKEHSFNHLVELFTPSLYRCALGLCHDRMQAEDLVQDTFLRAWRFGEYLQHLDAAKGWLFTILRRENARRYERPHLRISDIELENIPANSTSDEVHTDFALLHGAVANLPQIYGEPLMLFLRGGYTCEEIAKLLGLSSGAVWTRLHRARKLIVQKLGQRDNALEVANLSRASTETKTAHLGLN
jgi:RNA polymerase sigma-70 factor (ECF subfamily)